MICILFERNDYDPLQTLYNYGLGNDAIKKLTKNRDNAAGSILNLRTVMSMNDFIDTSQQDKLPFYIYEGNNPNTDCGQAINMVYAEPLWVGSEHLSIFSMAAKADYPAKDTYQTTIYQNMFNQTQHPMLHNATMAKSPMQVTPVPGPLTHLAFMFMPEDGKSFGNLNDTFYAVWRDKPTDGVFIDPEVEPKRHGKYKFLKIGWRQFRVATANLSVYVAQYVMTGYRVKLPAGRIPSSLPVYIRANTIYENGMRPIVSGVMKLNETEKIAVSERQSNMNIVCKKWWTSVVINRNFQHEDEYKNVSQSVLSELVNNKCADFAVLSDEQSSKMKEKENKVAVEDPDDPNGASKDGKKGDNGDGSRAGGIASNNKHSQAATGHNCFTQLHVILNRRFKDNIGDYAHSGCLDQDGRTGTQQQTVKSAGSDSKTALAQSRMNKVIMDTHATNYMKSQHNLSPLE